MKICEIFESIQGEGRYMGYPMLFIRTSGCTRKCSFCDTQYHNQGTNYTVKQLVKIINKSHLRIVCWTGGEPLLWRKEIKEIINQTGTKDHQIETNGDLLEVKDFSIFNYIACSPKDTTIAETVWEKFWQKPDKGEGDIKVVTDLKTTGKDLINYATYLMPLTTYNKKKDIEIQRKVWKFCVKNNLFFTTRFQIWVWGRKKNV